MAQPQARRLSITNDRPARRGPAVKPIVSQLPALWKAMILTSFIINIVLIFVVLLLVGFGIRWRNDILATTAVAQGFASGNVAELRDVIQDLQTARIKANIVLDKPLPLKGSGVTVPVDKVTVVTLQQPVPLNLAGADIDLGAGNRLRAQNISLVLPQGTPLEIALKMDIPLDDVTIPIKLEVPVDIAMADTELAPQFRRLGEVVDRLAHPAAPILGLDIPQPGPLPTETPKP